MEQFEYLISSLEVHGSYVFVHPSKCTYWAFKCKKCTICVVYVLRNNKKS